MRHALDSLRIGRSVSERHYLHRISMTISTDPLTRAIATRTVCFRCVRPTHPSCCESVLWPGFFGALLQVGNIVPGAFTPVLAKHTKHMSLVDILSVGVDRMQRNFEPMRKQVEEWKGTRLPDDTAKLVIYRAFVEGKLDAPKHLARRVHDEYFDPRVEEFAPRTVWSLSNAFTSAFKDLDPIPQFKTTAKVASFLDLATASSN